MKNEAQLKAFRSIRKPCPPPTRVERPRKGGGYKRAVEKRTIYE